MQADDGNAASREIDRQAFDDLVQRGLRAAVKIAAAAAVIGNTADLAADHCHQLSFTGCDLVDQRLHQHHRRDGVDFQHLSPGLRFDVAETHASGAVDTRVIQQDIDRPAGQLPRQCSHLLVVGHIQRKHFDRRLALRQRLQVAGIGGISAAGEHSPAVDSKLLA